MTLEQLKFIASRLKETECRRLIASLYFASYELPSSASLTMAEKNVPENVSCIELLLKWNCGDAIWEGEGKTHTDVERRLRQIGKETLADWLSVTAFHQMARDIDEHLLDKSYFETTLEPYTLKLFQDSKSTGHRISWVAFDLVICITLVVLPIIILACRLFYLNSNSLPKQRERIEMLVE
ncbi:hypothetical protein NE865_03218 [Phthorimaea operculella]|nr:hypothetical protein NE865_03218 [Phthorimaea operculella]